MSIRIVLGILLILLMSLTMPLSAQTNLLDIDEIFVENGPNLSFSINIYINDVYSGFEIPLKALSDDFKFDSVSIFGSILPSDYKIGWQLKEDSTHIVIFTVPPLYPSDMIQPTAGKLCDVYFHLQPEAVSQTVFIDTATFDVYSPDSSIIFTSYFLTGYNEEGLIKAIDFETGVVDVTISVDAEDEFEGNLPTQFKLYQNRPNPFNPDTRITYAVPGNSYINLNVYDINGRKVRTLDEGYKQAGTYTVVFQASDYATGFYFARLQMGDYSQTIRMLLLK